jgi:LiaF transmembrane domain
LSAPPLSGPKGRLALGFVFIVTGLALTLEQAGILNLDGIGRLWPLFFMGIGYVKVRQPLEDGQRAVGVALLGGGGFFQLISLLSWGRAWPLALVFVGGILLWQAVDRPPAPEPAPPPSPYVSELALVGGLKKVLRVPNLRGGYLTVVMGGMELDLRQSSILGEAVTLDVVAFWGGIDLKVPADWCVEGLVVPIMGGFEDKTKTLVASDKAPRLVVRGFAVMGAVVIGNLS